MTFRLPQAIAALVLSISLFATPTLAAEGEEGLLEILLSSGSITQEQYDALADKDELTAADLEIDSQPVSLPVSSAAGDNSAVGDDDFLTRRINDAVAQAIGENLSVKASYGRSGLRLESRDGNWQTNFQLRFQFRLTHPTRSDPRQVSSFRSRKELTFQARRLRMKIGGHGYKPWLKYYFEVDFQPTRDSRESSSKSSARVIDWRIDITKHKKIALRVGQWKVDYNRERVDSSGRQQFVERSIVNRVFTIDRQVGVSVRGHLFEGTPADLRYFVGVFTGEGRGVANDDSKLMYTARVQWNFLGRDLKFRQTDVERTELPTASLAFGAAKHTGVCTRWSSSGCGNLDGFASADVAERGQFRIYQAVEEFAFKYQGFSVQQEFHWKRVMDRMEEVNSARHDSDLYGAYVQTGYFFSEIFDCVPEELELAFRYAWVREPNEADRLVENTRQEFTGGANWFFNGHNNKLSLDYSYLTLDDDVLPRNVSDHRFRLQWDVSF